MSLVIKNINQAGTTIKQVVTSNDRGPKGEQGVKGETGVSVSSVAIEGNKDLITTLSNGESINAGELPIAISSRIYVADMDGVTTSYTIPESVDARKVAYILINGVTYTEGYTIDALGTTITLTFPAGELPKGDLEIVLNDTGLHGSVRTGKVESVNGQTGYVTITAESIGALPSTTVVPTKTSQITNDSGFQNYAQVENTVDTKISQIQIPTKVSELQNDSDYQTGDEVDMTVSEAISSLSIPTKTSQLTNDSGFQTASDVDSKVAIAKTQIEAEIPTALSELRNDTNFVTDLEVTAEITAAVTPVSESVAEIDNEINKDVVKNANFTSDGSTTSINLGTVNIRSGQESTMVSSMPVASASNAGVMNSSTYQGYLNLQNTADAILNAAVAITGLPQSPSQNEITAAWKAATGKTELINNASIFDVTNEKQWTYYTNDNTWHFVMAGGGSIEVRQWTNEYAGIVKGSENEGQIFAETDGTGSVNGWDDLSDTVENHTTELQSKVNTTDYATDGTAGIFKTNTFNAVSLDINHQLSCGIKTYNQYSQSVENTAFISKGTLNNFWSARTITLTQAQYDALTVKDNDVLYCIVES